PSALDFADGETLQMVAGSYPGSVPPEAGFALLAEVDGTRAEAHAQRAALVEVLSDAAIAIEEPAEPPALWRWRDGFNGVVTGGHGVGWRRRGRLASQWDARALELHELIKAVFDPKGLLNPGKKLAR